MGSLQKQLIKLFIAVFLTFIGNNFGFAAESRKQAGKSNSHSNYSMKLCWSLDSNSNTLIGFASDNVGQLFLLNADGKIISLNSFDGSKLWQSETGGKFVSSPIIDDENVYTALDNASRFSDSKTRTSIYSVNKISGLVNWKTEIEPDSEPEIRHFNLKELRDSILVTGNTSSVSFIYLIAKTDGRIIWKSSFEFVFSSEPYIASSKTFILGGANKQILVFSQADGKIVRKIDTKASPTFIVNDTENENLIWGDEKGAISSLNVRKYSLNWKLLTGGKIISINQTDKGLLIGSSDNFVYMVAPNSGKILWKKRFSGRILPLPFVKDESAVITSIGDSEAFFIDLVNGRIEETYSLPANDVFTSGFVKVSNGYLFSTLRGISLLSDGNACQNHLPQN